MKYAKKYARALASVAACASFAVALPAFAQVTGTTDLYGNVNAGASVGAPGATVNANSKTSVNSRTASSADSSGNASNASSASAGTSKRSNAEASGTANLNADLNAAYNTLNGSMSASGTSESSNAPTFVITRQDVSATTTGYIAPTNVTTADDFSEYARALMMTDENVTKIASNDNQVSVWYREPAKFLGIIPATVTVQASVDASGSVNLKYPWWYGMFVRDNNQAQFQSDLNDTAGTIARGEATTTLSSSAKARLVNALQSILKARYQSTAGTSTSETRTY